jgi:hypothetical protein
MGRLGSAAAYQLRDFPCGCHPGIAGQKGSAKTRWLFVCVGGVPQTDWAG